MEELNNLMGDYDSDKSNENKLKIDNLTTYMTVPVLKRLFYPSFSNSKKIEKLVEFNDNSITVISFLLRIL